KAKGRQNDGGKRKPVFADIAACNDCEPNSGSGWRVTSEPRTNSHQIPEIRLGVTAMNTVTYDNNITALLVVDPYNDFISEGGKIWPRIKAVAEANNCVSNMLKVLNSARAA